MVIFKSLFRDTTETLPTLISGIPGADYKMHSVDLGSVNVLHVKPELRKAALVLNKVWN
jgi:hypothetical protein